MTVASSKPATGTNADPDLRIVSANFSSPGPAPAGSVLRVTLSDDFFGPLPADGRFLAEIGGEKDGNLSYFTYADQGNLLANQFAPAVPGPGRAVPLITLLESDFIGSAPFAGAGTASPGSLGYPYSLTMDIIINHSGSGLVEESAFSAALTRTAVPEYGSTLGFLVSSLALIATLAGWRRST